MTTQDLPREGDDLDRLVEAARRGERPAFDELVRRTFVETYTLALRLTADEEDARDVVQEAYLRAWKGLPKFRGDARFTTWMYRITANAAYSAVKRRRRHRAEALDAMLEEPIELHLDAQPEGAAESALLLERLSASLDQLPPKLRVLVVLKDVYGMSHEEIAEELGISVSAAKVRLHRGRKRLRDLLYEDEARPDGSTPDGVTRDGRWIRAV
jgi:RNA polymerase sigma-70 factor (ECF subfamily)